MLLLHCGNTPGMGLCKEQGIIAYQRRALGINPPQRNKEETCILKRHIQLVTASTHLSEAQVERKFYLSINGRVPCFTFKCLRKQPAPGGWCATCHSLQKTVRQCICGFPAQSLVKARKEGQLNPILDLYTQIRATPHDHRDGREVFSKKLSTGS